MVSCHSDIKLRSTYSWFNATEPPDEPSATLLDERTVSTPYDAVDDQNRLFFEEVFDAEMLSLLPFNLDDVSLDQPEVAPGLPSL